VLILKLGWAADILTWDSWISSANPTKYGDITAIQDPFKFIIQLIIRHSVAYITTELLNKRQSLKFTSFQNSVSDFYAACTAIDLSVPKYV
jgi:hypothetical protein